MPRRYDPAAASRGTGPAFLHTSAVRFQVVDGVPLVFDEDFDAFTPRVALQYQFTDSVMGYASYAEGFNGGGVNARVDPTLPNNGVFSYGQRDISQYRTRIALGPTG